MSKNQSSSLDLKKKVNTNLVLKWLNFVSVWAKTLLIFNLVLIMRKIHPQPFTTAKKSIYSLALYINQRWVNKILEFIVLIDIYKIISLSCISKKKLPKITTISFVNFCFFNNTFHCRCTNNIWKLLIYRSIKQILTQY